MRAFAAVIVLAIGCQPAAPPRPTSPPVFAPPPAAAAPIAAPDATADVVRTTTSGAVTYTYRAAKLTYLTYTLDCLAKLVLCSQPAFAASWKDGWTVDDDGAIAAWARLRTRYNGRIDDDERAARAPLPIAYHERDVDTALRILGFGAHDEDDYIARFAAFAGAAEQAEARAILARFAPRLDAKWRAARAELVANVDGYARLGERADVRALLSSIAAFYTVGTRGAQQTFELVARPAHDSPTSAQQLGEHAVVEVVAGERPEGRYPVIAHEMFHAWFGASPIDAQVALVQRVVASGDPLAGPAWGLLDEVLATAFGNGLVARLVDRADHDRRASKDRGFYNDVFIDRVAKALLPALEKRLAANGTVFDPDFVTEYLAAVHAAFPDGLPPIAYLRPMFGVAPSYLDAMRRLRDRAHPGYASTYTGVAEAQAAAAQHTAWGTVLVVKRSELAAIAPFVSKATLAAAKRQTAKAFVVAQAAKPIGARFLFVADDGAAVGALIDAFATLPAPWKDGVIVTDPPAAP